MRIPFALNRLVPVTPLAVFWMLSCTIGLLSVQVFAQPSFGNGTGNGVGNTAMVSSPPSDEQPPVSAQLVPMATEVTRGSTTYLAVVVEHAEHYHTNLNKPIVPPEMGDFYPVPTTIKIDDVDGLSFGDIYWPTPVEVDVDFFFTGKPIKYLVNTEQVKIFIPVTISEDAQLGEREITVKYGFQACNETTCLPPDKLTLTTTISIVSQVSPETQISPIFDGFDPDVRSSNGTDAGSQNSDAEPIKFERKFLGLFVIPATDSLAGIIVLAISAAIGGFILNLTPCVLPVIPIKVMTISHHAGEKRSKAFMLSMWMAIGVITFWIGIGIPVAFIARKLDPSIIFGIWWLTAIIGIIIALMGVGIMGLFQIKLPQKVYMVNPKADSASGSFVFGIMTAVLGLPCFGFVAGALLAGAATMPSFLVLTVFGFIGIGMAMPYVVLAMFPKMIDKLPRTGPASELVKQIMGLLMIAAAAYFLGTSVISFGSGHEWVFPWWGKAVHWWVIGLTGVATGLWLLIQTIRISKKVGPRVTFGFIGLIIALSGSAIAYNQTNHLYENYSEHIWQPFTPELLQSSLDNGQVVVLDFTAEWCLNCKTLEAAVLSRKPVKPALQSDGVVAMVADLTSMNAPGWDFLRDTLDQTGIPLLVVYAPGHDEPIWLSNAYGSSQVIDAIDRARQSGTAIGLKD